MKTKTVLLRGVEIGAGRPKIIVPIVGKTEQEILDKAAELVQAKPDVVEWRVDYFQGVGDVQRVVDTARELNEALGEIPILFTFRTKREGGEKEIGMEDYTALNRAVAQSSYVDAVDVEIFSGDEVVRKNIAAIHDAGAAVVGSSHEFHRTPEHAELIYRLRKMQDMGADILKVAVMPQNKADVLTLLSATEEMYRLYAQRPLLTMSMASDGVISRLCGEVFGSAATFGMVGQGSAPGQIPADQLEQVLEILHAIGEKISEEKLFLTELDNVIGDGDHGINLARGFAEVEKKRPMREGKDIGTMLKTTGMALVSTVGGASGPLYGTAFMQAGKALAGKTELDAQDLVTILDAFVAGVQLRGKSVAGEKTMLDAMIPARDAVKAALDAEKSAKEALSDGVAAAEQGVEYTKTIIATKGRASYLGERSLGHQDPGATSFTTMLRVVAEHV